MLKRTVAAIGLTTALTMGAASCGAGAPSRSELVEALLASGIDAEKAECAADAVLDNLSDDEVTEIVERGPAGAPRDDPQRTDDPSDTVRAALAECRDIGATTTTTTASTTSTSSTTTAPADAADPEPTTDGQGSGATAVPEDQESTSTAPGSSGTA